MKKHLKGRRRVLLILCAALLVLAGCCLLQLRHYAALLPSQSAAERWGGDGELGFRQVSCYLTVEEPVTLNQIYAFRYAILDKLHEAGLEADTDTRLFRDAWSTTGKLEAASDLNHGQVSVIAVGGDFFQFHPLRLLSGNYLTEDDVMEDRILLDEEAAWLLFGSTDLAGMPVKLNGVPFVVSGVIEREQDFASQKAYTAGRGIFMSYDAFLHLNEKAAATCYELVLAEPVLNFTRNFAAEKFPLGQGELVENTGRFDFFRLLGLVKQFGQRSMQRLGVVYPYWENAARCVEDWGALLALLTVCALTIPGITALVLLYLALRRGKEKLTEELLPKAGETVAEAVRKRQRKAWVKKHGEKW